MPKNYTKSEITQMVAQYFQSNECKNLYKDKCINFTGETKDTKENYSKVIVEYLVDHIDEFKKELDKCLVTRQASYNTDNHTGKSVFKNIIGERREEKIAHAMYCQYKDNPSVFGKILDYQVPLKNKSTDKGLGKIDLISIKESSKPGNKIIYFLELKKDNSKETLLRCLLEAYTYSKIIDKVKFCNDFHLPFENNEFVVAPLVYKNDGYEKQLEYVMPLVNKLECSVEFFTWDFKSGEPIIEKMIRR